MKHLFALLLSSFSTILSAQIFAGDSTGLSGNTATPLETVNMTTGVIPAWGLLHDEKSDSLDLDRDGRFDVFFFSSSCEDIDCIGGAISMAALYDDVEILVDTNSAAVRLESGALIDGSGLWKKGDYSPIVLDFYGVGGLVELGQWLNNMNGYAAIRLTANSDTLYGWLKIFAFINPNNGGTIIRVLEWAVEKQESKPHVETITSPSKAVYCPGDIITLQAETTGADQFYWQLWDGTTDTSKTLQLVLPDSSVQVYYHAENAFGTDNGYLTYTVSPLVLTVEDVILNCVITFVPLSASTNIPADIRWIIGNDTFPNIPPPVVTFPASITVIATDEYGCSVSEPMHIMEDSNVPDVSIEFVESLDLLFAVSKTPGVIFTWTSSVSQEPFFGESLTVTESGTYTVIATNPVNGCTSVASINILLTSSSSEVSAEQFRILPNPAADFIRVENRTDKTANLVVYDVYGKMVSSAGTVNAQSNGRFDVSQLTPGMYWIVAQERGGKRLSMSKLVKI